MNSILKPLALAAVLAAALCSPPASAATLVESASTCLADSTSGKERKDLARWMAVQRLDATPRRSGAWELPVGRPRPC